MATAQRVFWETVAVLAFIAFLGLAWFLSGYRAERKLSAAEEGHRRELAEQAENHRDELGRRDDERAAAAAAQAQSEAEAVFHGYAAGIRPAAAARWRRFLNSTRDQLVTNPRVVFLHVMTPGGYILTSTDPDLVASGRFDETADWVTTAEALVSRDGEGDVLELAGPIDEGGQTVAFVWMGYDVGTTDPGG